MVTIEEVADTTYSCPNSYVVTRTFTATDEVATTRVATQTITIQDTTAPEFGFTTRTDSIACGFVLCRIRSTLTCLPTIVVK